MACDTDGRFAVGRRRGGTGLASHGGPSCQNPVERWAREVLLGPSWCPAGYGCRRLTSAVCWEFARKLFAGQTSWLVRVLRSVVCKSIAKASKVRILHLPPRAERAPDQRKRRSGALLFGPAVIGSNRLSTAVREEYVRKLWQPAALRQPSSMPMQPRCAPSRHLPGHIRTWRRP